MPSRLHRAVEQVLSDADRPLSAEEIARILSVRQLVSMTMMMPELSVLNVIRRHIRLDCSPEIVRTTEGRLHRFAFARRELPPTIEQP